MYGGNATPPFLKDKASQGHLTLILGLRPIHKEKDETIVPYLSGTHMEANSSKVVKPAQKAETGLERETIKTQISRNSLTDGLGSDLFEDIQSDHEASTPCRNTGNRARGRTEQRLEPR